MLNHNRLSNERLSIMSLHICIPPYKHFRDLCHYFVFLELGFDACVPDKLHLQAAIALG
jgi:hypothetical protein